MNSRIKEWERYSYDEWVAIGKGISEGLSFVYDIPHTELFVWDANPNWIKYGVGYVGRMDNTVYMVSRSYAKSRGWLD